MKGFYYPNMVNDFSTLVNRYLFQFQMGRIMSNHPEQCKKYVGCEKGQCKSGEGVTYTGREGMHPYNQSNQAKIYIYVFPKMKIGNHCSFGFYLRIHIAT